MPSGNMLTSLCAVAVITAMATGCGGEGGDAETEGAATTSEAPATDPTTTTGGAAPAPGTPGSSPTAGGGSTATTPAAGGGGDAALVQQGQQIFVGQGNCQSCHMPNGQGGPLAPNLTDNQWIWFDGQRPQVDELVTLIKTGVATPKQHPAPMPAMGGGSLSEEQLRAVSMYVLSISGG